MTVIEMYADVWCPFAHVGLRSLATRRDLLGRHDLVIRVRAWPLELVNGKPLDPATTTAHVNELRVQVAPDLFAGFDPDHFPATSLPALALTAAAYRTDDRAGEAVSLSLRAALFEHGQNIADPDVLAKIARAHGIAGATEKDRHAVLTDWHQGQIRGVQGSPHFFCGHADAFCPALDISKDATGQVLIHRNVDALDHFLIECFNL